MSERDRLVEHCEGRRARPNRGRRPTGYSGRRASLRAPCSGAWVRLNRVDTSGLVQAHLRRILFESMAYFNRDRPHQGLQQRISDPPEGETPETGTVCAIRVLGGLHQAYHRAA